MGEPATAFVPGPGAYEPEAQSKKKEARQYEAKNSSFRSGSRRELPWGGGGSDAPRSTRARKIDDLEQQQFEGPGPGDYALPGAFQKAAASPRRNAPGSAWATGAARFAAEPSVTKVTPSSFHYTPNYSQCS